jgi:hypothetical protein
MSQCLFVFLLFSFIGIVLFNSENEFSVNPMVKGFREQLDSDDEQHQEPTM